jgi:hypothetical protein
MGDPLMPWGSQQPEPGTRHNRQIRGRGTWGSQGRRLNQYEQNQFRREMGRGTWSDQARRVDRAKRQRDRNPPPRTEQRKYGVAAAVGVFVLSMALLVPRGTRPAGMIMLVFAIAVVYVIAQRKKA